MADSDELHAGELFQMPEDFADDPPGPRAVKSYIREPQYVTEGTPSSLNVILASSHPLYGHCLSNSGVILAKYIDAHDELIRGKSVIEFGGGAALPSLISTFHQPAVVYITDFPEPILLNAIHENVASNIPDHLKHLVHIMPHRCGFEIESILNARNGELFDVIIMSDLIFNHNQHVNMLESCRRLLAPNGIILFSFSNHTVKHLDRDMAWFPLAESEPYGFVSERIFLDRMDPMFPKDPGDIETRAAVHGFIFKRKL